MTSQAVLQGSRNDYFHTSLIPDFTSFYAPKASTRFWWNSLLYPAYIAALSAFILIIHLIFRIPSVKRLVARVRGTQLSNRSEYELAETRLPLTSNPSSGFLDEIKEYVRLQGGPVIFAFGVMKLLSCLALVGLTIYAVIITPGPGEPKITNVFEQSSDAYAQLKKGKKGKKHRKNRSDKLFSTAEWYEIAQCAFYCYASLLALLSLAMRPRVTRILSSHLNTILLFAFGIFAYRDLFPLTTYTLEPKDGRNGWLTWSRIGILTFAGVAIPLCVPREFTPLDPKSSTPANPEQTASLLSFLTFSFLDPVIAKSRKNPHLPYEDLPSLADYDYAEHLVKRSFPTLDPAVQPVKGRHLFWGLMSIFGYEYMRLVVIVIAKAVLSLAGPVATNQLLYYLETKGRDAVIRPWIWIVALFVSQLGGSILIQWYIWITTRMTVNTEAIITQLVFEHSLKIRLAEDVSSAASTPESKSTAGTAPQTPDAHRSTHEGSSGSEGSEGTEGATTATAFGTESQTSTVKGKAKDVPKKSPASGSDVGKGSKPETQGSNLVGKINNLVSTDLGNLVDGRDFVLIGLLSPLLLALCIWFLYAILGWSAFVGLFVMLVSIPLPGWIAQLIQGLQSERMKKTDSRVQAITETMNVIRMIKLFGWEKKIREQITEKRDEELRYIKSGSLLNLANMNINYVLPLLTMISTFATYTLVMKRELSASKIFSAIAAFDLLRDQLMMVFWMLPPLISAKVSLDRVTAFLNDTELLDRYAPDKDVVIDGLPPTADHNPIGFKNATFSWRASPLSTPGSAQTPGRNFQLRIEGELLFKKHMTNLIIGATGCGKTSLLMALLGEMHFRPETVDSWFNLPRNEGVAYASQESWVQNATIKDNIVFGAPFDEERYKKVLHQCALERDLTLFEGGDLTEVGEKGMTLSGGQKARVTLARAIYSNAEILLLDDILSALDVHTSRWIVDKCLRGDLVQGRTVLLVTHNVSMAAPIADFVVALSLDGRILSQGTVAEALSKDPTLRKEVADDEYAKESREKAEELDDGKENPKEDKAAAGKLIAKEEIQEGRIGWPAFRGYLITFGGTFFWLSFLASMVLSDLANVMQAWFLGYWARQYEERPTSDIYVPDYLTGYGLIVLCGVIMYTTGFAVFTFGSIRASRIVHNRLLDSILGTTLRWLDSTPSGRIIARFTQDIRAIDRSVPMQLQTVVEITITLILKFVSVLVYSPIFTLPGIAVAWAGGWVGQLYMRAQLAVKRETSNARSPLYSHFGAAIAGLVSIRAYGAEAAFKSENMKRINYYSRPGRTLYNVNRWVCVRIDLIGGAFAAGLAAYLVYAKDVGASNTGFSLTMAIAFSQSLLWWVRMLNEFEVAGNSLERIQGYIDIEQEPKNVPERAPPAYWPSSGSIVVENLSAKYSVDGPEVLRNISFEIKSGERVGVVGRTGAGKSSLSLALLRMIPTSGAVYLDGMPTDAVNLESLRSSVTIIPQQPELMSGTLRQNLDPFEEHDDAALNDALRSAGLFNLQSDMTNEEDKINLDTVIASGGGNFSLGQRQIIALARAMVRRSKVYILDEATASVDYATDKAIQQVIATEFNDMTLIIVAHRLQTVMGTDKVLVLDAGKVIEFDSPANLLAKEGGSFKALVDGSGDREALYEIAKNKM